jgi:hypothetical protein
MNVADECAGCFRPIRDRFLLKVLDKPWHTGCVRCELCRKLLDEKCFYKEGKMYCKDDFYRSVSYCIYHQHNRKTMGPKIKFNLASVFLVKGPLDKARYSAVVASLWLFAKPSVDRLNFRSALITRAEFRTDTWSMCKEICAPALLLI